jgi:hypothetical protein
MFQVCLHDAVKGSYVQAGGLESQQARLENGFWCFETLGSDFDDLAVGKFVHLLLYCLLRLVLKVRRDVTYLPLEVSENLHVCILPETKALLPKSLHQVVRYVAPGCIDARNLVEQCISAADGHNVGGAVSGVNNNSVRPAKCVEPENSAIAREKCWGSERLEGYLGYLLSLGL